MAPIMKIAKTIVGALALAASTGLGFLPHDDPWFNVLTAVVAIAGAYGVYQIPNKPTARRAALGAAVGAVVTGLVPDLGPAPAKTFPAAQVAAVTPVYEPPATPAAE